MANMNNWEEIFEKIDWTNPKNVKDLLSGKINFNISDKSSWNGTFGKIDWEKPRDAFFKVLFLITGGVDLSLYGERVLILAAVLGHVELVELLISAGINVDTRDNDFEALSLLATALKNQEFQEAVDASAGAGMTALMLAVIFNQKGVVKVLIDSGADVNIKDNCGGTTALQYAIMRGGHEEIAKSLISAGAALNLRYAGKYAGKTALMMAADKGYTEIVKALIDAGADLDLQDKHDWTALMFAAKNGRTETVKTLIDAGADVNYHSYYDSKSKTALMVAVENGRTETVKTLIDAGADVNWSDYHGKTVLMYAAEHGRTETVKTLIDAGADVNYRLYYDDKTALMYAAENGHVETVKVLIENGAKVFPKIECFNIHIHNLIRDAEKIRADYLKKTSWNNTWEKIHWDKDSDEEILKKVKYLINSGVNVDLQDADGYTELMWAAENGHEEVIKALINAKANVNLVNNEKETALMWAAYYGYTKIVKNLIAAGANVKLKNNAGETALSVAEEKGYKDIMALIKKAISPSKTANKNSGNSRRSKKS